MLSGCAGKDAPDEFMVLRNPPLVMPPDFHLVPKKGGAEVKKQVFTPQDIAKKAVHGSV
jgi:hypothetical protein